MGKNKVPQGPTEVDQFVQNEKFLTELRSISGQYKELEKRFKSLQSSLDLIYNDRDLLKDITVNIEGLKALVLALDKHNENLTEDLKQSVVDTHIKVEEKAEEVKDTMDFNADQIREHVGEVTKMKVRMVKGKGFIRRLFRR